jgi:hypothetical protein
VLAWSLGLAYRAPSWLIWVDGGAAVVGLVGVALLFTPEVTGLATWPLLVMALFAAGLFGLGSRTPWLAWINFALAFGYLGLTAWAVLRPARPLEPMWTATRAEI